MRGEPHWLSKKTLLLLHEESLATFGGASGLRDEGLLDSALARPCQRFHYEPQSSLAQLAASLAFGIVKNHPFIDGNKRAAFLSIGLFLHLNGQQLIADPVDATTTVLGLASGLIDEPAVAVWIESRAQRK